MTELQKLTIRASEIRTRMAELAGIEELSDEQRSEVGTLRGEYRDVETRIQAATVADSTPEPTEETAEDRELRELEERSNLGNIFEAAIGKSATDGAEAELQQHLGLQANQVPLALLRPPALETRNVTVPPDHVGASAQPILPYVFPEAVASFLGVAQPSVGVGEMVYPVLTTAAAVAGPFDDSSPAGASQATFTADVLSPERLQASYFYRRVDRARFAGMDAALRQNLGDALGDSLDEQILAGGDGLLTGTNLANHPADDNAVTTYAEYIEDLAYGRVDGRYANMTSDLRIVLGAASYGHAGSSYRNASVDRTALDRLMELTAGVRVSAHVPAVASNKQNAIVRRGARLDMVAPIWEGVTLIPDEVTKAGSGEIVVTAVMLHAVKILRVAGFHKQELQVSSRA